MNGIDPIGSTVGVHYSPLAAGNGASYAQGMTEDPAFTPRPTVLLGSGFSRAISDAMPTMNELGDQVIEDLQAPRLQIDQFGGDLEQWMTYLSVDQPWLSTTENLMNRAMFTDVSASVGRCILRAENQVMATTTLPTWLHRLVWTWCDLRAHVMSFNYDTLIERAVGSLGRLETWGDLYAAPLGDRAAAGDGGTYGADPPSGPLLSLYKLHGSTSWSFGGLDGPSNDRILLNADRVPWMAPGASTQVPAPRDQAKWDDVVPLIIPPTLTKGPYFSNLALRAQWIRAAWALRASRTLTIMGYSFPTADIVARQWVGTSFGGFRMDVVDHDPKRPRHIRETLIKPPPESDDITGDGAIERYVDRECGPMVRWKIWNGEGESGAQAELWVNDTNLLADMKPDNRPWGTDWAFAQRWIHDKVTSSHPSADANLAHGPLSYGGYEERHFVLPLGTKVTI